jgi:hypothetical protein
MNRVVGAPNGLACQLDPVNTPRQFWEQGLALGAGNRLADLSPLSDVSANGTVWADLIREAFWHIVTTKEWR